MDLPLKPQVVARGFEQYLWMTMPSSAATRDGDDMGGPPYHDRGDMQFSASARWRRWPMASPIALARRLRFLAGRSCALPEMEGLTMLMGELATIAKYQLPIKVMVMKNNVLGMIKWEQLALEGNPQYGVQLQPIDFMAVARACGVAGYTVDDPHLVPAVLSEAFHHGGRHWSKRSLTRMNRPCREKSPPSKPGNLRRRWRGAKRPLGHYEDRHRK